MTITKREAGLAAHVVIVLGIEVQAQVGSCLRRCSKARRQGLGKQGQPGTRDRLVQASTIDKSSSRPHRDRAGTGRTSRRSMHRDLRRSSQKLPKWQRDAWKTGYHGENNCHGPHGMVHQPGILRDAPRLGLHLIRVCSHNRQCAKTSPNRWRAATQSASRQEGDEERTSKDPATGKQAIRQDNSIVADTIAFVKLFMHTL
jgi:hypothetical protein